MPPLHKFLSKETPQNQTSKTYYMTETTKRHLQLIRELVTCYADHPEDLRISATEVGVKPNGRAECVYWRLQGRGEDHGKLTGKGGVNVRALALIVEEMGDAQDSEYRFQLIDPPTMASPRVAYIAAPIKEAYDEQPLCALLGAFAMELVRGDFTVLPQGVLPGRETLTYSVELAFADQRDCNYFSEEILPYLNTLLRAMQRKQGALVEATVSMAKKAGV
jgi:predicted RNA-binding protein YlqC (UPF0109 family)